MRWASSLPGPTTTSIRQQHQSSTPSSFSPCCSTSRCAVRDPATLGRSSTMPWTHSRKCWIMTSVPRNETTWTLGSSGSFGQADHPDVARFADALREYLTSETLYLALDPDSYRERWSRRVRGFEARFVSRRRMKRLLVGGLGLSGLWALGALAVLIGVFTAPPDNVEVYRVVSGPEAVTSSVPLESVDSSTLVAIYTGLALRGLVGLLLVAAALLLVVGRERRGVVVGYFGLLLSLTTVILLDFYFSQFRAIAGAAFQFALLLGVIYYQRRYLASGAAHDLTAPAPTSDETTENRVVDEGH